MDLLFSLFSCLSFCMFAYVEKWWDTQSRLIMLLSDEMYTLFCTCALSVRTCVHEMRVFLFLSLSLSLWYISLFTSGIEIYYIQCVMTVNYFFLTLNFLKLTCSHFTLSVSHCVYFTLTHLAILFKISFPVVQTCMTKFPL